MLNRILWGTARIVKKSFSRLVFAHPLSGPSGAFRAPPKKAKLSSAHPYRGSSIRSRPVGYAAEYLTLACVRRHMGSSPLMSMYRILYHFYSVCGINASIPIPNIPPVSIDSHSENHVFPFSSSICIQFIRSHRPHAAPSKYSGFSEVVLVCVPPKRMAKNENMRRDRQARSRVQKLFCSSWK